MYTDMTKHAALQSTLQDLIRNNGIKEGVNASKILDKSSEISIFNSQQFMMNVTLHACDISTATRPYDISAKWTALLQEEFFYQGD